ncbi:MAG: AAA family ATPase [Bacillota bacterium]|nr:AAA family ATPase [Bacillota bacterium]
MYNETQAQEKKHLTSIIQKLQATHASLTRNIGKYEDEIQQSKNYIWENKSDLDGAEKASNRIMIHQMIDSGEQDVQRLRQIERLIVSPYFGRVDFKASDREKHNNCYIGLHTFSERSGEEILIHDWRAPISTLFYDYDKGPASYESPSGPISGQIDVKRQYKIRQGAMEYMIESDVNIIDDVLQKELSQNANDKMKNIVVTIQREQNAIIRNATAKTLIVQGVAGSGKTSIALHRVAFLLYRNSETLSSDNMLIISPNKVFADYISNVLPELGEENIQEIDMMEIAAELLEGKFEFQSFSDQVNHLILHTSKKDFERIQYKATEDFLQQLHQYLHDVTKSGFVPQDLIIDGQDIKADTIRASFNTFANLPIRERLEQAANDLIIRINMSHEDRLSSATSRKIKSAVIRMFPFKDELALYANFYKQHDNKHMLSIKKGHPILFEDVFPLIYTKLHFENVKQYERIEHLLVDEMQDYTPVQYTVLQKLFPCKKTILGDSNQSVNPYTSSTLEKIRSIFPDSETVKLCKSYRSTMEITSLAQSISRNEDLVPVERHGEEPGFYLLESEKDEHKQIRKLIRAHLDSDFKSLGIICKSIGQAEQLYQVLSEKFDSLIYLDFNSREYRDGIIITSAQMAKGLEFDQVIVPHVSHHEYHTQLDRSLLYIACTRAMHKLDLTCHGKVTDFFAK